MIHRSSFAVSVMLLAVLLPCVAHAGAARSPKAKPPARAAAPIRTPSLTEPEKRREQTAMGRTTIAPFPLPGDTSRASADRLKMMNVPREGATMVAPVPPPGGVPGPFGAAWGGLVLPERPPSAPYAYPRPLSAPAPEYPEAARKAGIQGTVLVSVHVMEDGSVSDARIVRSIPALDAAALACARQMKFAPPTLAGKPTSTEFVVPVRFTLH